MSAIGRLFTLFMAALALPALGQDLEFDLFNESGLRVRDLYLSPAAAEDWSQEILGIDRLEPGETGVVVITGGAVICVYDLLFVTDDGAEMTATADLCETRSFTLRD